MGFVIHNSMQYRSIFISDVHLGTRGCKAEYLLSFLKQNECENLYLVGDIIDGWRIRSKFYWPQSHNNVIRRILTKAKRGTNVIYVTGNHDEFLRNWVSFDLNVGDIKIVNHAVHESADGKNYWVIHGDSFDGITRYHKWLAILGDHAYAALLTINIWFNWIRRKCGFGYWSLSSFVKQKAKQAVNFIHNFEDSVIGEAINRGYDGVICGHIHKENIKDVNGKIYMNCGDWVESCTAIVEHNDGKFEVIRWIDENNNSN